MKAPERTAAMTTQAGDFLAMFTERGTGHIACSVSDGALMDANASMVLTSAEARALAQELTRMADMAAGVNIPPVRVLLEVA